MIKMDIPILDVTHGLDASVHTELADEVFLEIVTKKLKLMMAFLGKVNARSLSTHIVDQHGKKYKLVYSLY